VSEDQQRRTLDPLSAAVFLTNSVNADNAASLFAEEDLDGALVGGASLEAGSFWAIVEAAQSMPR
jgi:triosephosphate isomerase